VSPALALALLAGVAPCPAASPVAGHPGSPGVARLPAAEAMRANGEGKQLYRQEKWTEAREKYRAALAADPELLGAALNVACSFSRQSRYDEAANEAAALIRRAYVPWSREVEEAADLGILQSQPAFARLAAARREAAPAWGRAARLGVLFVARTRPPVKVTGEGVLVLGLNQEVFSWNPETGRYLQVTAEDGRVLAFAASPDGGRVAYLLAGRLVRSPGQTERLRGLGLRVLELSTMTVGPLVPLPEDVVRAELWFAAQPRLRLKNGAGATSTFALGPDGLEPGAANARPGARQAVLLTGRGVEPTPPQVRRGKCGFSLRMRKEEDGPWRIEVVRPRGKPFALDARFGAGLRGLPFPGGDPTTPARQATDTKE